MSDRRVALVTGGSRGIGAKVVPQLARDGFDVAFCYQSNVEAASLVAKEVAAHGRAVFTQQVDVSVTKDVEAFVKASEAALGPVHALVSCAGIVRDNPLVMTRAEDWRAVLGVNLDGTYNVCRAAVFSMMRRKAGVVVTMSSVAGVYGHATQTNYSASKAGVIGFTKALAKEVGKYRIRANVVAPGFVETDMTAGLPVRQLVERIPLGRFGQPEEIADLVSFLVSDRAGYITGQVFGIDGGLVV